MEPLVPFSAAESDAETIDLTGDTPEKPTRARMALTIPGQRSYQPPEKPRLTTLVSRVGVRADTVSNFIYLTNVADKVKAQSKEDTRIGTNKFKAPLNLYLYIGEYRTEIVVNFNTRKLTQVVLFKRFQSI